MSVFSLSSSQMRASWRALSRSSTWIKLLATALGLASLIKALAARQGHLTRNGCVGGSYRLCAASRRLVARFDLSVFQSQCACASHCPLAVHPCDARVISLMGLRLAAYHHPSRCE